MSITRVAFSAFISVIILCGVAAAQESGAAQAQAPAAATVTAAASASGVRFVSTEGSRRIRLEVYGAAGERLYDSDFRQGSILDWDGAGLADGSYLCVVTVEDLRGAAARRLSAASVQSGRALVRKEDEEKLKAEFAQALAAVGQSQDGAAAAAVTKKTQAVTVTAHDGQDGQVTSTAGALTFRTGDVFSGRDKEQMRVTPEGRVGIGTDKPEATLDVAGTIRARGGIVFPDGSVLNSAPYFGGPAKSVSASSSADGVAAAAVSGGGTAGRLTKWADSAGTLADSALTESGGNVGIGTNNPDSLFTVEGAIKGSPARLAVFRTTGTTNGPGILLDAAGTGNNNLAMGVGGVVKGVFSWDNSRGFFGVANMVYSPNDFSLRVNSDGSFTYHDPANASAERFRVTASGNVGIGTAAPAQRLDVAGNIKISGAGNGIMFSDGTTMNTASGGGGSMTGTAIISAVNDPATAGTINDNRLPPNVARLGGANNWSATQTFGAGLSAAGAQVTNVGNPVAAADATNKGYVDSNFVKFVPGTEQLSVGDANGTAAMVNLRGGSTCCSGPGGHTPAWFKVFQNGSFVATGNLGIGVSPMQGKGYRTSWDSYKGAFRSGYADAEWDDANVGFFSWAGGSNSTAVGLYSLAFGDTNSAESTSSIVFGSGNQVKGAAGFSAGAGNRVCDTYGVAFGNKAQSGGPLINGRCDPDSFNIRGLAAVAMGYNVTADQDHTMAFGKFASNNGFTGTFVWSDGSATASADTFRNTANNEFAARATGGFRFRTNLAGTTGCNLPAGSGVFNCTSSRYTKENFSAVSGDDVLARLRKVPVSTWNYISEGRGTRHLGPMAEDFYQAFGLGPGNTSIGVQDAVGVSLAAVKALDARTTELQQKAEEVEQLRAKVNSLEQRLAALEQLMQQQNAKQPDAKQQ